MPGVRFVVGSKKQWWVEKGKRILGGTHRCIDNDNVEGHDLIFQPVNILIYNNSFVHCSFLFMNFRKKSAVDDANVCHIFQFYYLLSMIYLPPWSVSVSHLHRYSKATKKEEDREINYSPRDENPRTRRSCRLSEHSRPGYVEAPARISGLSYC